MYPKNSNLYPQKTSESYFRLSMPRLIISKRTTYYFHEKCYVHDHGKLDKSRVIMSNLQYNYVIKMHKFGI